jgi:hypothetical protein
MRITSLLNEMIRGLLLGTISFLLCQVGHAEAINLKVSTGRNPSLEIADIKLHIDRTLRAKLRKAEEVAVLPLEFQGQDATTMKWLLVRQASRSKRGVGYCGAGNEDHLILIKLVKSSASIADDFLAQSCLKAISMDVDQFEDVVRAIEFDDANKQLVFSRTVSSEKDFVRQRIEISVVSDRMRANVREAAE